MGKEETCCQCTTGCDTLHCACIKAGRSCTQACGCVACDNPLNKVHVDQVSGCAIYNIEKYKHLSKQELEACHLLPCGCESQILRNLIGSYQCSQCEKIYHYSFCFNEVIEEGSNWNCEFCGSC